MEATLQQFGSALIFDFSRFLVQGDQFGIGLGNAAENRFKTADC